jgi:transcriptional regulator of acetoin/glycerol metabolism
VRRLSEQQRTIARARDEFVASGIAPARVGAATARSWRRCVLAGLVPDQPIRPRFGGDVDEAGLLLRATGPVAAQLTKELSDADVAMLLADRDGRILGRWAGTRLLAALDAILARPGYIFDEADVGTSALGTAVEEAASVTVLGTEHFMSCFDGLCAVGAPIRHPATGRLEGVIDIVCPAGAPVTFMLPLINRAAREIEDRLVRGHSAADRALLDGLLRTDRRGPRRPTVALNERIFIANSLAGDLLPGGSGRHSTLWAQVERAIGDGEGSIIVDPDAPSGPLYGHIRKLVEADGSSGVILHLHHHDTMGAVRTPHPVAAPAVGALAWSLPGRSAVWQRVLRDAQRLTLEGGRLLLVGPEGAGKHALARAVAGGRSVPILGWDAVVDDPRLLRRKEASRERFASVLLRHLDHLHPFNLAPVLDFLDSEPNHPGLLVATYRQEPGGAPPSGLVARFDHVLAVPGIDDRREDIPDIVAGILRREAGGGLAARCTPEALHELMRREWPGNVRQLERVLLRALRGCHGRSMTVSDLPRAARPRRARARLSRLERAERETIFATLSAAGGNKRLAAAELGISRSTLYRKIDALGLDV